MMVSDGWKDELVMWTDELLLLLLMEDGNVVRVFLARHVDAQIAGDGRRVPAHVAAPDRRRAAAAATAADTDAAAVSGRHRRMALKVDVARSKCSRREKQR